MKPFPNRTSTFQRIRLSPVTTLLRVMSFSVSFRQPSAARSWSFSSMTAEALRPATALPVALGGRHSPHYSSAPHACPDESRSDRQLLTSSVLLVPDPGTPA